jgi:hypothetical protein
MRPTRIPLFLFLSLTAAPGLPPRGEEPPLPRGASSPDGPLASDWTPRSARVQAVRVRLNALGARTHANWVLFRLPFDVTQKKRLRSVRYRPSCRSRTDVGALRIGSICINFPPAGTVEDWTLYTVNGLGRTSGFAWHPAPPTDDPTILGINVPTRVANYVACGRDEGHLLDPEDWTLDVTWEER